MKKKILQLIGSFHQGGSERQASALARGLKNDGTFDVFVATLNKEGVLLPEIEAARFSDIPEFPLTSFYNTNFVKQVSGCAKYLQNNKIDIIHTHDFYTNVFGMAAATLAGTKVKIASKRETGGMRSRSQDIVEKIAFGRANSITANSKVVKDYLVKRGITSEKIEVIYNGIDPSRFASTEIPDRASLGLPTDERIRFVTLVANLRHPVKNIPMLMRAAKQIANKFEDVHFVIAGEGDLQLELGSLAASLEVEDKTHFIGRCADVPGLLAASYACVLTSTAEGFSNSIIEYMAAGKPVVATNVGGAAEAIVDSETGYLIGSDDDGALAEKLTKLLDDENKAKKFGTAGRSIASENFSAAARLRSTIELYERLLK